MGSLDKALIILKAFCSGSGEWGVRELASKVGFSPTTVQRVLSTLREHGFLDQDEATRKYRLGSIYYRFVEVLQSQQPLIRCALPLMKRLCSSTGETTHLNVIDGIERLCISSIESTQNLKAGMPVGNRSPLYAGASSKCLLAFSADDFIEDYINSVDFKPLTENTIREREKLREEIVKIRSAGFAESLGERTPGLGSLSVPIFGWGGSLMGALSLAIPELRFRKENHKKQCLTKLTITAEDISRCMGYGGKYPPDFDN